MAGPATNVATIGAVYRTLGPRVITIYLATVILSSLGFGLMFDQLLSVDLGAGHAHGEHGGWLNYLSAILLLALLGFLEFRRQRQRQMEREAAARVESGNQGGMVLQVGGMTCGHCVASVKNALEAVDQVEEAIPELSSGRVRLRAAEGVRADALREAVEQAGFQLKALNQET
jgi:copper chaperone CopZ